MTRTIYICLFEPEGRLKYDTSVRVAGVFATKEEAIECLIDEINNDIQNNDYVVDEDEYEELKNGDSMWINVYYEEVNRTDFYYCMSIIEQEVNF